MAKINEFTYGKLLCAENMKTGMPGEEQIVVKKHNKTFGTEPFLP